MAKGKGKKDSFQTESGNSASQGKVCITVPAALAKSFRLKEDIEDIHGYIDSLSPEELAMAAVRVGERAKNFKEWFFKYYEVWLAFRDTIPARGPNRIQIGGWVGTLGEFTMQFWGVSLDWVRKLGLQIQGMSKFPHEGEVTDTEEEEEEKQEEGGEEEKEEPPTLAEYNAQKALVANLKQLNLTLKIEAETARKDLLDLTGEIEKVGEKGSRSPQPQGAGACQEAPQARHLRHGHQPHP
jgi:hypothetical protein